MNAELPAYHSPGRYRLGLENGRSVECGGISSVRFGGDEGQMVHAR